MRVFFAIPSYSGIKDEKFLDSLEATLKLCQTNSVETSLSILQGCCYVQMARIKLLNDFLQSGADKLFFLDDDLVWNCEDALRVIQMQEDFAAGIYPFKKDFEDYPVVINVNEDFTPVVRADGCISGALVPTGFLCVSRSAIEKLIAAYPEKKFTDRAGTDKEVGLYDLFPQGVDGGRWVGEDYAFCKLWTKIKGEIWIIPDITLVHRDRLKNVDHTGNYHEFLLRQPK
jgi:hypothetical protein